MRKQKTNRKNLHHKRLVELDAVDDAIHGYLACISYADAMIGRDPRRPRGRVPMPTTRSSCFWSDHGYHHGEKGDWGKHTLWERTSNVPFIWAGPGIAKGAVTDATVSLIDMYPDLRRTVRPAGAAAPAGGSIDRRNPRAIRQVRKDRDVYLPYMEPGEYAIINRDWRYIHYADGTEELYDVQAIPTSGTTSRRSRSTPPRWPACAPGHRRNSPHPPRS